MKKNSVNTFTEGLVCDLDPINVPNNVLTDCLNGTIITYDGNEYSLQNDKGNFPLKDCKLRENFIPVGIKEYNGILYIVSLNPMTGEEEIGSYPSPKLYDGGAPHGDLNVEYVIDRAFEEANSEELDYSELESKCKSWYYADPKLKLNVGDKFWFEEDLNDKNFEKIEEYIVDENSVEHLILEDWLNSDKEYVSPISGTICLKNKIFEFANSSAEINTFVWWKDEIVSNSELSTTEPLGVLFSFTYKLYIDDSDSLQWISKDVLKYKIDLKVNGIVIHTNIYENRFNSLNSSFDKYQYSIESKDAMDLEWYQDNKIISKYFTTVIKGVLLNDEISVDITPIIETDTNKNVIISDYAKPLNNSISNYTSTTWRIGYDSYKFYNSKNDNYSKQYIELDISGPIEASDDLVLKCNIKDYNNKSLKKVITFNNVGVGKNLITIEYDDDFVKEDAYWVDYSINISGSVVKSEEKLLITSELFNYDDYRSDYKDYTDIPNSVWIPRYEETIKGGSVTMTLDGTKTSLPKSLYTYITGNEDYVNRNIPYPNFIEESSYLTYSKFKEARLSGDLYNASISVKDPTYLTGPLWDIHQNPYVYTDSLGKQTKTDSSESKLKVPAGIGRYVNFNSASKVIVGRIINTYELNPPTVTWKWEGNFDANGNNWWGKWTLNLWENETLLKTYELVPRETTLVHNDYTSEIKKIFSIDSDLINIRMILSGHDYQNIVRMTWDNQEYYNTEILIKNACQSTDSWFVYIPDPVGIYVKIDSDKDEKYQYGYWCDFSLGSELRFADPEISVSKEIVVRSKINYGKTFVWNSSIKQLGTDINLSVVDSEISNINSCGNNDKAEFDSIVSKYIIPSVGEYVKGIVDSGDKTYIAIKELSENYRNTDKLEIKGGGHSDYVEWTPWLEYASSGGGTTQYNNITAYFAYENGGWL